MHKAARILVLPLLLIFSLITAGTASAAPPPPASMAALGDSITQAADACCWYGDHPANSWSTGNAWWDGVLSHYERIRPASPNLVAYNNSQDGAKAADLPGQASAAVAQGAQYVTVLMGANDVCTSSPSTMTSTTTFSQEVASGLATLESGLPPGAHIFVSSIPDIYHLWQILHTNSTAEFVWTVAQICQSMLSPSNTEDVRRAVREREIEFNTILGEECSQYANCLYDGGATFAYQFTTSDVSYLDYFHPSLRGQADLASVTWSKSWWPNGF